MSTKKWSVALGIVMILSMVLSACATPTPVTVEKIVEKPVEKIVEKIVEKPVEKIVVATPAPAPKAARPNVVRVNTGVGDIPSLDPNVAEDTSSITVIENSFVGLTRLNEVTSELQPGMATKWTISPDGLTFTFTLRNDVPWVRWDGAKKAVAKVQTCPDKDGKTKDRVVTAKDFEYGILRALNPKTASPYAYVLAFVIAGANDYNSGTITDTAKVGVKAVNDTTLEMKFLSPAVYNLNIAGLWTAYATPTWLIDGDACTTARAERWIEPGFFQSYGPYTLKEWVHDSTLTIVKNPFWPGSKEIPQAKVNEVTFSMLDESPAMAEFESGNLDAVGVPSGDMDRVKADAKLSKQLVSAPNTCTYYLGYNTKAKYVDNANLRRALSFAVDRQKLIDTVLKGGQEPAQWFGRPGIAAAPTMKDSPTLGVKFDVAKAKEYLAAALKELNITADKLDVSYMFNTSSGHQKIAEFVQQQWKDNLGLNIKLTNQEWKVYLVTTKSKDTPQIFRMGWCMDYPDENNFINEVVAVGGSQNPAKDGVPTGGFMWKNDKFEKLVKDAAVEMDAKKRLDLYKQAEQLITVDDPVMIPLYWYTRNTLTQPHIKRTFSVGGHEIFYNWEVTP
ncbi:MAG: oligopeptide transport system substrate-binding protein [Chloroflexota bacterium]|nr:oligopeptide transport system substrate-binding protein [Chloroflexota bacterium]